MKKNMTLGLLVMATGLVLAGCASLNQKVDGALIAKKWDKSVKTTAVLYFDASVRIHAIDGKENTNIYGQAQIMTGSGTVRKPKVQLAVPAGERTLTISYADNSRAKGWTLPHNVQFTFAAGRYYQLTADSNLNVQNPKTIYEELSTEEQIKRAEEIASGGVVSGWLQAATQAANFADENETYAMDLTIIDITGGKKRNSPSTVITVKHWEQ